VVREVLQRFLRGTITLHDAQGEWKGIDGEVTVYGPACCSSDGSHVSWLRSQYGGTGTVSVEFDYSYKGDALDGMTTMQFNGAGMEWKDYGSLSLSK
jgi:hypothetical protein